MLFRSKCKVQNGRDGFGDPSQEREAPGFAKALSLRRAMKTGATVRMTVVHRQSPSGPAFTTLTPGVDALSTEAFVKELYERKVARGAAARSRG